MFMAGVMSDGVSLWAIPAHYVTALGVGTCLLLEDLFGDSEDLQQGKVRWLRT